MRRLFLILAACAPGFASTVVNTLAGCDGVIDFGTASASCEVSLQTSASAEASTATLSVDTTVNASPPGISSAEASLSGAYVLTVTGGSGDAFAEPQLSTELELGTDSVFRNYASVGLANASGGCTAMAGNGNPFLNTCTPTAVPFVFNTPQVLFLIMFAETQIQPGAIRDYDSASAAEAGFVFYGANGQVLNGVTYSFVPVSSFIPTPEPGMFPLLAAMACAVPIARRRRRRS
jgi:hypothetical protein